MNSAILRKCHQSETDNIMGNMDTSARPKKRMRLTSALEKKLPTLYHLRSLGSFKMSEHCDQKYECAISEMLLQLEASVSIKVPIAQKLHKIILVNMGFSLNLERSNQTLLLAKCLHELYRCTWRYLRENCYQKSVDDCFGKLEIQEAFVIILQGLEGLKGQPSRLNSSKALSFQGVRIQIIHQLIFLSPGLREMIGSNRNALESILYVVVDMPECIKCEAQPSRPSEVKDMPSTGILAIIKSVSPTAMRLGALVECILSDKSQRVSDQTKSSKADQVFYIKCLLIRGAPDKYVQDSKIYEAISFTNNECLGENYLSAAVDCFCLMVDNWSMAIELDRFFELIVDVLLERSKTNDESTRISVKCFEILTRTPSTRCMLLGFNGFNGVVQFLLDAVFKESECEETKLQAADVLCSLAAAMQKSRAHNTKEECDPYQLLTSLLTSDDEAILYRSVLSTHELLKATNGAGVKHDCCCRLISLLTEACFRGFGPSAMTDEVVEIFQLLVKGNEFFLDFLARQPNAVSLIVHDASPESCDARRGRAFSLLLQMTENPSNHRIMARQPGLLSAFFRYARSVGNTCDQREETKDRALRLVKAL